jgi:hypothetical protein
MPKRSKTEGDSAVEDSGMEEQNEGGVIDSAKQAAGHLVEQVKEQAASRADQQRHTVASGLAAVADAFRNMGDELRSRGEGRVAEYAAQMGHTASGQVERLAHYLHGRNVRQVASDLEDVARRSPGMFLGGAFVLGLAASRFLKSSRPAPDFIRNMPDPNRGLPPASTR